MILPVESYIYDAGCAKPFLKWAGGKSQMLDEIWNRLPAALRKGQITRYVEPFVGGGAVFFALSKMPQLEQFLLLDSNEDLILTYRSIQTQVEPLIEQLARMEALYKTLSVSEQEKFFYKIRDSFNEGKTRVDSCGTGFGGVERAAQLLFLNKTCFNGLYRLNSKGRFNTPFGRYKNPTICPAKNLRLASQTLNKAEIRVGDFETCESFVDSYTFVYFDPPYRPLNKTAQFTSYTSSAFDEHDQRRLAALFRRLDCRGAKLMLSNSDPKNMNLDDDFFDDLYVGYSIERVKANRMINCNAGQRGEINEIIITNY